MPQLVKQNPKSLKPTTHDTIYWNNTGVQRLGVRVRPDHPPTYVLCYRPPALAKERRIKLGLVNEISLTEARKRATARKAEVYQGLDLLRERSSNSRQTIPEDDRIIFH